MNGILLSSQTRPMRCVNMCLLHVTGPLKWPLARGTSDSEGKSLVSAYQAHRVKRHARVKQSLKLKYQAVLSGIFSLRSFSGCVEPTSSNGALVLLAHCHLTIYSITSKNSPKLNWLPPELCRMSTTGHARSLTIPDNLFPQSMIS